MPLVEHRITRADILAPSDYAARRSELRKSLIPRKDRRRVEVGPFATLYFENYDTMWLQVHEMLHIEKGGAQQIEGELDAYNPLIPQGSELIATLMLEIEDPQRRDRMLRQLAGIEEAVSMDVCGTTIKAVPTEYEDRTTPDGKTSSVHWLRFSFTQDGVEKFKSGTGRVVLEISHPNYEHMAVLRSEVRAELATDFA